MTIREYLNDKLKAFGITDSMITDATVMHGINVDYDVADYPAATIGRMLISTLEELILAPRLTNVNENGFSMSWDFAHVADWYRWLCRKWGVTPNGEVTQMLGLSTITDRTDIW